MSGCRVGLWGVCLPLFFSLCGASYTNRWGQVRGVNYVPSYSSNPIQTWMDYDAPTVNRELQFAQNLGLNTVRVFLHMFPYLHNRSVFLSNYDSFVSSCDAHNIKPLVVLFDDDFYDVPNVTSPAQVDAYLASGSYRGAKWMANPGNLLLAADYARNWTAIDAYLADVAGSARANDSRVLGYDVMNEPHREPSFQGGLPEFITHVLLLLPTLTTTLTTVDDYSAAPADLHQLESALSFHSYWQYGHWEQCAAEPSAVCGSQAAIAKQHAAQAGALNKPLLVSEMGQLNCYCPAAKGFGSAGVGWIMWELMLQHDQFSQFQGLVYPNGTYRNTTEADCIRQLADVATLLVC